MKSIRACVAVAAVLTCFCACLLRAQTPLPLAPAGIAYDTDGNLFIADAARNLLYRQTVAGTLSVIAGTGEQGFAGDNGPATAALFNQPSAVAVASDGTLYIADTRNHRIRSIDTAGIIHTVAGTGTAGDSGDNSPAIAAQLRTPQALALRADGTLLIADTGNHRIRALNAAGILTTVAGTGTQGFAGDGGPATSAALDTPAGLAILADGRTVIADSHNHRLRILALDGTLSTLAGRGVPGFSGDSGAAIAAQLSLPRGVVALADGRIVFADSNNQRLRAISAAGVITTITANGIQGSAADATLANATTLNNARAVAASPYGAIATADVSNRIIRALLNNGSVYSTAALAAPRNTAVQLSGTASTANISVTGAAATPQGKVLLLDGTTLLASATLDSTGSATLTYPALGSGPHILIAHYLGDGYNPEATATTTISITSPAATTTTLAAPAATYIGLSLTLTAHVTSNAGTPTGTVTFADGGTVVAQATLLNGAATAAWLTPSLGTHAIVATYSGDANHASSSSAAQTAIVQPVPDFTLTATASAQSVPVNTVANYTLSLASLNGTFSGAVSLSASGLPANTTITFAPPQAVPGASGATVTLSIPTDKLLARSNRTTSLFYALLAAPLLLLLPRRRRLSLAAVLSLATLAGCGDRTVPDGTSNHRTYIITVTGTATSLAGTLLTHSATLTLSVQ